jgi:hypothetical protein
VLLSVTGVEENPNMHLFVFGPSSCLAHSARGGPFAGSLVNRIGDALKQQAQLAFCAFLLILGRKIDVNLFDSICDSKLILSESEVIQKNESFS